MSNLKDGAAYAQRAERLQAIVERLSRLEQFTVAEAHAECRDIPPAIVTRTLNDLERAGRLAAAHAEAGGPRHYRWECREDLSAWTNDQVYQNQIKLQPEEDRPRERLIRDGAETLSDADLLAILIRVGIRGESAWVGAAKLLAAVQHDLTELRSLSQAEMRAYSRTINVASYAQIMAGVELGRRIAAAEARRIVPTERITSSAAAIAYCQARFAALCELPQEEFHIVTLDTKHKPLRTHLITRGTLDASLVHPREVFRKAIRDAASAVLLVHNHPSGDPTPSREDRTVTDRLMEVGRLVGIEVLDHIIVTRSGGLSIREA